MSLIGAGWLGRLRGGGAAAEPTRWVVVDVETTGLDTRRDRLLAIAGVGVQVAPGLAGVALDVADSFECVLRQAQASDRDNILVHRIGVQAQLDGSEPAEALAAFERWVAGAPLVAFHADFDRSMIRRAFEEVVGRAPAQRWLDLEPVARAVLPAVKARSLDDWMRHFGITCAVRHQAIADTWATGELLIALRPRIAAQARTWRELERLAAEQRWLGAS